MTKISSPISWWLSHQSSFFSFLLFPLHCNNMDNKNSMLTTPNNNSVDNSGIATVLFDNTMSAKQTPTSTTQHKAPLQPPPPIPLFVPPPPLAQTTPAPVAPAPSTPSLTNIHDLELAAADLLDVPNNARSVTMPDGTLIHVILVWETPTSCARKLYTKAVRRNLSTKDTLTFEASVAAKKQKLFEVISVSVNNPNHIAQTYNLDDLITQFEHMMLRYDLLGIFNIVTKVLKNGLFTNGVKKNNGHVITTNLIKLYLTLVPEQIGRSS